MATRRLGWVLALIGLGSWGANAEAAQICLRKSAQGFFNPAGHEYRCGFGAVGLTTRNCEETAGHDFKSYRTDACVPLKAPRAGPPLGKERSLTRPGWEGNHPSDLLAMRLFVPLQTHSGEADRLRFEVSHTNTWNPAIPMDGLRFYDADGVVRNFSIAYDQAVQTRGRVFLRFDALTLTGGVSVLDDFAFVSDRLIESVHAVIGDENAFGRDTRAYDQGSFLLRDENGRTFRLRSGESILGRLDVGYVESFDLIQRGRVLARFKTGAHGSLPLNPIQGHPSVAASGQLDIDFGLGPRSTLSFLFAQDVAHTLDFKVTDALDFMETGAYGNSRAAFVYSRKGKKGAWTTIGVDWLSTPRVRGIRPLTEAETKDPHPGQSQTHYALNQNAELLGFSYTRTYPSSLAIGAGVAEDLNLRTGQFLGGASNRQDFSFRISIAVSPSKIIRRMR